MSEYVPLHLRDDSDAIDEWKRLHDGIPPWMTQPVLEWLHDFAYEGTRVGPQSRMKFIYGVQMALRTPQPYPTHSRTQAADTMLREVELNPDAGLTIIDYALMHVREHVSDYQYCARRARDLALILERSNSVWGVEQAGANAYRLVRSDLAEAQDAVGRLVETTDRPGVHLANAWSKIVGRETDANGAYDQAVRAVEAAAHPVITPNDQRGQLGKIASAISDAPTKWSFALGTMDTVEAMIRSMSRTNARHGTSEKVGQTDDEALAAVHTAIALVGYFTGGAIARVGA